MAEPFVQSLAGLDLTIEQGTERSPGPTRYYVFYEGKPVSSHHKLADAQRRFKELRDASGWTPPQKEALTTEEVMARERDIRERAAYAEYWGKSHQFSRGGRPKRK